MRDQGRSYGFVGNGAEPCEERAAFAYTRAMENDLFARHRAALMERMGEGVAILPAAPIRRRNRDVDYLYRPDSDFYYLTGFDEPQAVCLLIPGRPEGQYVLFVRPRDPDQEVWTGRRAGLEGARAQFAADEAHLVEEIDQILPTYLENTERLYYTFGKDETFDRRVVKWLNAVRSKARQGIRAPRMIVDVDELLHEMRLVKGVEEIAALERAAAITADAHIRAMAATQPGRFEYEIRAELEYVFQRSGAHSPGYPSIVASGPNACTLHYVDNDRQMAAGDLLLVDAAAEYGYYTADVTRTWPVSGQYTGPQRDCYEIVLAAQAAAIAQVQAGHRWDAPHNAAVAVLAQGMLDLGLLSGTLAEVVEKEAYRRFYMHRTGHWLGMDVHDVGDYKNGDEWRELAPGMVLTVEPGLYIAAAEGVDPRFHNIGIRIEDDCLVTADGGPRVLTAAGPKTVAEVEATVGQG